jgi:L-ribulokinase
MPRYSLGIDYGTSSSRALLVDLADGAERATAVHPYSSGIQGVITGKDPDLARQEPADYLEALEAIALGVLAQAAEALPDFQPSDIVSIGFATTGSTPLPIDASGTALSMLPQFSGRLAAKAWLWKDHTAHAEAARLTETARKSRPEYMLACGGTYSAEWFWAKLWHCASEDPEVFDAADSWVELCDFLVGQLTDTAPGSQLRRSITAAGHKALYSNDWGGLPDEEFLNSLDPRLGPVRAKLYDTAHQITEIAGTVSAAWAERTGLAEGTPVSVGYFDAHAAGVAAGVRPGTFVKVMGTSTCDVTVVEPAGGTLPEIPGMCGVVRDALIPGLISVEAGQSAVGDTFNWLTEHFLAGAGAIVTVDELGREASRLAPGSHGLLALDWFNGNRSILVDQRLTGLIMGLTLHTDPSHVLRALVEATAFGSRRILETVEAQGTPITTVVAAGGIPNHAPWIIQCYADVFGREIIVSGTSQGSAFGAALVAAVAAGEFDSVQAAQDRLVTFRPDSFTSNPHAAAIYEQLYAEFTAVHDAFAANGPLGTVMKNVIAIRDAIIEGNAE